MKKIDILQEYKVTKIITFWRQTGDCINENGYQFKKYFQRDFSWNYVGVVYFELLRRLKIYFDEKEAQQCMLVNSKNAHLSTRITSEKIDD